MTRRPAPPRSTGPAASASPTPARGIDLTMRNPEIEINGGASRAILRLRSGARPDRRAPFLNLAASATAGREPDGHLHLHGTVRGALSRRRPGGLRQLRQHLHPTQQRLRMLLDLLHTLTAADGPKRLYAWSARRRGRWGGLGACWGWVFVGSSIARADDAQVTVVTPGGAEQTLSLAALAGSEDVVDAHLHAALGGGESSQIFTGFSLAAILEAAGADPFGFSYLEVAAPGGRLGRCSAATRRSIPAPSTTARRSSTRRRRRPASCARAAARATSTPRTPSRPRRESTLVLRKDSPLQVKARGFDPAHSTRQAGRVQRDGRTRRLGRAADLLLVLRRRPLGERRPAPATASPSAAATTWSSASRLRATDAGASAVVTIQVGRATARTGPQGGRPQRGSRGARSRRRCRHARRRAPGSAVRRRAAPTPPAEHRPAGQTAQRQACRHAGRAGQRPAAEHDAAAPAGPKGAGAAPAAQR